MFSLEELSISSEDLENSPELIQSENCEDIAAADAAKELFGNDLIQEIQQNEVLDWDDIISQSTELPLDPTLSTCTTLPMSTQPISAIHGCDPITTTVEMENSAQYFVNSDGQDFDIPLPMVSQYYSLQPQHINVGFWFIIDLVRTYWKNNLFNYHTETINFFKSSLYWNVNAFLSEVKIHDVDVFPFLSNIWNWRSNTSKTLFTGFSVHKHKDQYITFYL